MKFRHASDSPFGIRHFALLALLVVGCRGSVKPVSSTYNNAPTVPLDTLLSRINANAGQINTLVMDGRFTATLANGKGGFDNLDGGIQIVHTKPNQIRVGTEVAVVGQRAFDLGSNGQTYWMSAFGKVDTTWYGKPRGTAEVDPRLPIAPELLIDVLGVATLNDDLLAQPIPTLRYNPDQAVYMLTWHQPIKDRWVTLREVWYDRETFLPTVVILFDRNGRAQLRAKLSDYRPITLQTPAADGAAPRVAHRYELFFPEPRSALRFTLDNAWDEHNGAPSRRSYAFNPSRVATSTVINLDEPTPASTP